MLASGVRPRRTSAESLQRGTRVVAQGRLKQRSFETREGEKRTVIELDVDEIGPSLRYATAKVNQHAARLHPAVSALPDRRAATLSSPWGTAAAAVAGGGGLSDEPPF